MLRRRYRGGRGGRGVRKLLSKFRRRALGTRKTGPWDQYIFTLVTNAFDQEPNLSETYFYKLWGWGEQVGQMLTNIRAESPFELVAAAEYLYQPTLVVYGFATVDVLCAGNAGINCELVVGGFNSNGAYTITDITTTFDASWAQSYDDFPTDYQSWPSTSVLENFKFWDARNLRSLRPTSRIVAKVGVGRPKRFTFRFKTRRFTWEDYSQGTFLTDGYAKNKSFFLCMRTTAERQQVCGVKSAVNQPILTEGGSQVMVKVRQFYFYRWIPGNNKPTIYGSNLGPNETVSNIAYSWIGVPAQRAQRFSGPYAFGNMDTFGGLNRYAKNEAAINPVLDCPGDPWIPEVNDPV